MKSRKASRYGVGWRNGMCLATGKVRFRSEEAARDRFAQVIEEIMATGYRRPVRPLGIYHCATLCGGWHFTSAPVDEQIVAEWEPVG